MNRSRLVVVISIISVLVIAFSGIFRQPVYANSCSANITSTPSDANVYVDGRNLGKTPYYYFIGNPSTFNLTIVKDGYQKWSSIIVVPLDAHVPVQADLVPLPNTTPTVTKTVTTIVTTISPTTITSTSTATSTTTATTTIAVTSTFTQSAITATKTTTLTSLSGGTSTTTLVSTQPAQTTTIISSVTEQTGFPSEVTYATAGIAVIAIITAAFLGMRKKQ